MTSAALTARRASGVAVAGALLAIYLFWGSTFLGIRFAIVSFPPLLMGSARFLVAGAILFAFARARGAAAPTGREWLHAAAVGALLLGIGNGAVAWSEQFLASGLVALMVSASPVWMVLFDRVLNGVRLTWPQLVGIAVGLVGIVILVNPTTAGASLVPLSVLAVSSLAWAGGTLASRRRGMPRSTTLGNGMSMLAGGAVMLPMGLFDGELGRVHLDHVAPISILGLAWLIVFGSLVGFSCYLWLLRVASVVLVSTQSYVSPVVAVVLGVLVAGEHITGRSLVAGGVILLAVVLIASAPLLTPGRASERVAPTKAA